MRVLIVEDDDLSAEMLQHALEQFGYDATRAAGGQEAFEHVRTGQYRLVVSDWEMPGMTGIELCRRIRRRHGSGYVYVILLTSRSGTVNAVEGLNAGADDFISKPFQAEELCLRLRAGERLLSLEGRDIIIFTLAKLAESRDSDTGAHLERIREYCRILAQHLSQRGKYRGVIDGDYVQLIYLTSPLHDIGKVGIPDNILLKPGRLTTEEFEVMKRHTTLGYETLSAAIGAHPEVDFLQMAREIAYSHHEKYDGSGYP
ncbi:MAG: response regulator, partial [Planctomycetaceae bacterium]